MKKIIHLTLAVLIIAIGAAPSFAQKYALTNATIVPVTSATITNGTLVIEDEKITAVGTNVRIPSGAETINCKGLFIYPGMFDPNTNLGMSEIAGVTQTQDQTETGTFNTFIKASSGVDPNTIMKGIARWNGITNVISSPRAAGPGAVFGGQEVLLNLGGWTLKEMTDKDPVAMYMTFPTFGGGGGRGGFGGGQAPATQQSQQQESPRVRAEKTIAIVKDLFESTKLYIKAKEDYTAKKRPTPPEIDQTLEGLIPVVKQEIPLTIAVSGIENMREAIKFVKETNVKAVFYGASDAFRIADELAAANIPIIYTETLNTPNQTQPYDLYYAIPSILYNAGVKFCFGISSTSDIHNLPFMAGMSSAYGLPKDAALKAVTIYPAEMYGVDKLLGSLEVGKLATVVVTNGDLLEPATKVIHEFIRGMKVNLADNWQYQQYLKYRGRPIIKK